jgi:hypothetical protein
VGDGSGGTCGRCGYAAGEANRCPHCGAVARTEPPQIGTAEGVRAVCAVCGGPRIPNAEGGEASAKHLVEQRAHLGRARLASAATVFQGMFAALATLAAIVLAPATLVGKAFLFAIALVPLLLAVRSRGRAAAARKLAGDAGEKAWQAAAEAIAKSAPRGVTAAGLAKALAIDEAFADRLLTSLAVHDRTRIDVGDDAEVRYSVAPETRTRITDETADDSAVWDEMAEKQKENAR